MSKKVSFVIGALAPVLIVISYCVAVNHHWLGPLFPVQSDRKQKSGKVRRKDYNSVC